MYIIILLILLQESSQQSSPEDLLAQRKEDLDKIFPERKNLALDLPSDVDLYKMRRRIKYVKFYMRTFFFVVLSNLLEKAEEMFV